MSAFTRVHRGAQLSISLETASCAAEARKMLGIRREVWNAGIDDAACALGQPGKAGTTGLGSSFEDEPQPLFDQVA